MGCITKTTLEDLKFLENVWLKRAKETIQDVNICDIIGTVIDISFTESV